MLNLLYAQPLDWRLRVLELRLAVSSRLRRTGRPAHSKFRPRSTLTGIASGESAMRLALLMSLAATSVQMGFIGGSLVDATLASADTRALMPKH